MKNNKGFINTIKRCWGEISFKDKGLMLIMIILLAQCIHNLFNVEPINSDYAAINVIVRTSVAGIFGYFLSANFLAKSESKKVKEEEEYKLEVLAQLIEKSKLENKLEEEYDNDTNKNKSVLKEKREAEQAKREYFCNKTLQNGIAVGICLVVTSTLIIGVNLKIIPEGSLATITQFRDLISGCIGFLLGNGNAKSSGK